MTSDRQYEGRIDGQRVQFHRGTGWQCDCETFALQGECQHTIKAAALLTWGRTPDFTERRTSRQ
jgi:hypothetical protein